MHGKHHSFSTHARVFLWTCHIFETENISTWGGLEPPTFAFMPYALNYWAIRARYWLHSVYLWYSYMYWVWILYTKTSHTVSLGTLNLFKQWNVFAMSVSTLNQAYMHQWVCHVIDMLCKLIFLVSRVHGLKQEWSSSIIQQKFLGIYILLQIVWGANFHNVKHHLPIIMHIFFNSLHSFMYLWTNNFTGI